MIVKKNPGLKIRTSQMDHKLCCKKTRLQSSGVCADDRRSWCFSRVSEVAAKTMLTAFLMAF